MSKETEIDIDAELILEKAQAIGAVIDGLRIPEIFGILGVVITGLVRNAKEQGVSIDYVVSDWLRLLRLNVDNIYGKPSERGS